MLRISNCRCWLLVLCSILSSSLVLAGKPEGSLKSFAKKRSWSDPTGRFKIDGQLEEANATSIKVRSTDGKLIDIETNKLSESDQSFIASFLEAEAQMNPSASESASDPNNPFQPLDSTGSAPAMKNGSSESSVAGSDNPFQPVGAKPATDGSAFVEVGTIDNADPKSAFNAPTDMPASYFNIPTRPILRTATRPIPLAFEKSFWRSKPPYALNVDMEDLSIATDIPKEFFAKCEIMAAGKSPVTLLNIYREGIATDETQSSSFNLISMKTGDASPTNELRFAVKLVALSPDGKRALGVAVDGPGKYNLLIVMNVDANGIKPDFQFVAGGGERDELRWASFLPNNRIVSCTRSYTVTIWNLSNPNGVTIHSRGNLGSDLPVIRSPGNDQVAIINKEAIAILDGGTLKQTGCIVCDVPILNACFATDGATLYLQMPHELAAYSTTDGSLIKKIPVLQPNLANIRAHGKYVLLDDVLIDLDLGIPIWTYKNAATSLLHGNTLIAAHPTDKGTTITSTRIPHDQATILAEQFKGGDLYSIVPGTRVNVQAVSNGGISKEDIEKALVARVRKIGWEYNSKSNIVVVGSIEQGATQIEEYETRDFRFGGNPFRPSGPIERVSTTSWTHKVEIKRGDEVLYSTISFIGSPYSFFLQAGESAQSGVNRHMQPNADYFKQVNLPPYLWKPEYQKGFGVSKIEAHGLQSVK
jgi:hypothetical protein